MGDSDGAGADERPGTARPYAREDKGVTRLLFVCLGNICRSPTAEGVMRALVDRAGLEDRIELDSAGTGAWHVGNSPDDRAAAAARSRGIELDGRARQIRRDDFDEFDLIVAMDGENLRELRRLAPGRVQREKVRLLREFDPASGVGDAGQPSRSLAQRVAGDLDVPDPYYAGAGAFEEVLDLVQAACAGLLEQIRSGQVA